jgi:lipopolysaccharide biosynthesis protein
MHDYLPRALIMAHYDPDGLIDPHVLYSLAAYRRVFAHITFVSVSVDRLPLGHEHLADVVIARENIGYDFFSWKVGFNALRNKDQFFEIVFANDSVYGPFFDIEHVLTAPRVKEADFWGMTNSLQRSWHIQSFFFAMRHPLLTSNSAQAYWDDIDPLYRKDDVIARYEIPMASFFRDEGWATAAVYDPPNSQSKWDIVRIGADPRQPFSSAKYLFRNWRPRAQNPMHYLWCSAIHAGVPFIKVELLRSNPLGLPLEPVREFIAQKTRYPLPLIDAHVQRTNKAPS